MQVDHVLLAEPDSALDDRVQTWAPGLQSLGGGRHPGWGTANRIVPLGDAYLELVSVVDEREARASAFGRWVLDSATHPGAAIGWAVRPSDLDATAERLELEIRGGSRRLPSGEVVAWRSAGVDEAAAHPWLPFFIEWRDQPSFPGRMGPVGARLVRIEVEGDVDELGAWLGVHALPLHVRAGDAGIVAVTIETPAGRVVLGARPAS